MLAFRNPRWNVTREVMIEAFGEQTLNSRKFREQLKIFSEYDVTWDEAVLRITKSRNGRWSKTINCQGVRYNLEWAPSDVKHAIESLPGSYRKRLQQSPNSPQRNCQRTTPNSAEGEPSIMHGSHPKPIGKGVIWPPQTHGYQKSQKSCADETENPTSKLWQINQEISNENSENSTRSHGQRDDYTVGAKDAQQDDGAQTLRPTSCVRKRFIEPVLYAELSTDEPEAETEPERCLKKARLSNMASEVDPPEALDQTQMSGQPNALKELTTTPRQSENSELPYLSKEAVSVTSSVAASSEQTRHIEYDESYTTPPFEHSAHLPSPISLSSSPFSECPKLDLSIVVSNPHLSPSVQHSVVIQPHLLNVGSVKIQSNKLSSPSGPSPGQMLASTTSYAIESLGQGRMLTTTAIQKMLEIFQTPYFRVLDPSYAIDPSSKQAKSRAPLQLDGRYLVIPIHHPHCCHWTLAVIDVAGSVIEHYDSLRFNQVIQREAKLALQSIISVMPQHEAKLLIDSPLRSVNGIKQQNGYDCGVAVIVNSLHIFVGEDAPAGTIDGAVWRCIMIAVLSQNPVEYDDPWICDVQKLCEELQRGPTDAPTPGSTNPFVRERERRIQFDMWTKKSLERVFAYNKEASLKFDSVARATAMLHKLASCHSHLISDIASDVKSAIEVLKDIEELRAKAVKWAQRQSELESTLERAMELAKSKIARARSKAEEATRKTERIDTSIEAATAIGVEIRRTMIQLLRCCDEEDDRVKLLQDIWEAVSE